MSYYATIDGMITLRKEVDRDEVLKRLDSFLEECDPEIMSEEDENFTLYFGGYQNYDDDAIRCFLVDIQPHTISGVITYCGEDNSLWRHFYDPSSKVWVEQDGYVAYEDNGKSVESLIEHAAKQKIDIENAVHGDDIR